jgi:hypothetical protein
LTTILIQGLPMPASHTLPDDVQAGDIADAGDTADAPRASAVMK